MSPMRLLCLLALLVCVSSFLWGMSGAYFRRVGRLGRGFRAIQAGGALALACNVAALLRHDPIGWAPGMAALGLYVLSLAAFWWAVASHARQPPSHAFSADLPEALVRHGPYRLVRHPFYASYLLTWSAAFVATQAWPLLLPLALMSAIYVRAAHQEERKFEASPLAGHYAEYRARTGMFLPRWRPKRSPATACGEQS